MSESDAQPEESRPDVLSDDEVSEIEEERERRLDSDNRPDNAEVDNTGENMPDIAKGENQPEQ